MTALTALIAKFVRGRISRREFSDRVLRLGFGALTVESILDNISPAQEHKGAGPGPTFEAFSAQTPFEQWSAREGIRWSAICSTKS